MCSAPAVLFDVDGTLVDSNYLHVHAWRRAFADCDIDVETWRIHRSIGMDGARLVQMFSPGAPAALQRRLSDLHAEHYRQAAPLLRTLPGARQLLDQVAALGLQVVLATSAPADELAVLRRVLDRDELISAITSAADVDTAKPDPAILAVALERAGVSAGRAIFVGDAIWDAQACRRAGLRCIGVLSGGVSRAELAAAGADPIFENAAQLLSRLDETPIGTPDSFEHSGIGK